VPVPPPSVPAVAQRPEGHLAAGSRRIPAENLLALGAKLLASALWVSGRSQHEAWESSVVPRLGRRLAADVTAEVDAGARTVTLRDAAGTARTAVHAGDQGSIICTEDGGGPAFAPVPVGSQLPDARTTYWPLGDAGEVDPGATGMDVARLGTGVDAAFDEAAHTSALVVVHRGEVVAERYAEGAGPETQLESWSMGKSVAAALVGVLVGEGALDPDGPPPLPEWQGHGDARRGITVRHLLQMSSGLRFSGVDDWEPARSPVPDHVLIYMDAVDVGAFVLAPDLEHQPGTIGRYRNCDPLALMAAARAIVEGRGEDWLTWPQRALFDPAGVRRQVLETDRFGNFIITGFDYGTARNWARLGLLFLEDGVFAGRRVLPAGWARVVSTPAPAWGEPVYGGLFWLNGTREWALPPSAYCMAGDGNQRCFIVPSHDLVVVRLGHSSGSEASGPALNDALAAITAACP
jgi:CubicO group peptidase (beta-lactamase class C family)